MTVSDTQIGEAIYRAMYQHQGGLWEANETKDVWAEVAARFRSFLPVPSMIGDQVVKPSGYGFPGEVRAVFETKAGLTRYVIEATGDGYAGMLHIFSPSQVEPKP